MMNILFTYWIVGIKDIYQIVQRILERKATRRRPKWHREIGCGEGLDDGNGQGALPFEMSFVL